MCGSMNGRWVHFSRRCAKMTEELGVRKRKRSDSAANQAPRKQAPPKYTKEYLDSFEGTTVPDIGSSSTIKLLFVGINPGEYFLARITFSDAKFSRLNVFPRFA